MARSNVITVLSCVAILSAISGCAGNMQEVVTRVGELDMRCQSLSRTNTALRGRVDDLENRVLLLQDEVETQRLMGMRVGSTSSSAQAGNSAGSGGSGGMNLPVVKLTPVAARSERADSRDIYPGGKQNYVQDLNTADDFVTGADSAEPDSSDVQAVDGGSLEIGDSYAGIDDMGRVIPATGKRPGAAKKKSVAQTAAVVKAVEKPEKNSVADPSPERKSAAGALNEYRAAYSLYSEGRLDEARESFGRFVSRYPRHAYADNARYWVGECWYDKREFEMARTEFMRVISDYPDGNKVPDAMVKVGLCDQNLGRMEDARRMYDAVILTYPDSDAAGVAMKLIGRL